MLGEGGGGIVPVIEKEKKRKKGILCMASNSPILELRYYLD
jgi:hypothetical protein